MLLKDIRLRTAEERFVHYDALMFAAWFAGVFPHDIIMRSPLESIAYWVAVA